MHAPFKYRATLTSEHIPQRLKVGLFLNRGKNRGVYFGDSYGEVVYMWDVKLAKGKRVGLDEANSRGWGNKCTIAI